MSELRPYVGIGGGAVALLLLVLLLHRVHRDLGGTGFWESVLVVGAGVAAGWLAGFFASPRTPNERTDLAGYAGLLGAFLSGYLLS